MNAKGVRIGEAIDAHPARFTADLLVTRAFGRSRMLEFVLGGATEQVSRAPPTAVFQSH